MTPPPPPKGISGYNLLNKIVEYPVSAEKQNRILFNCSSEDSHHRLDPGCVDQVMPASNEVFVTSGSEVFKVFGFRHIAMHVT